MLTFFKQALKGYFEGSSPGRYAWGFIMSPLTKLSVSYQAGRSGGAKGSLRFQIEAIDRPLLGRSFFRPLVGETSFSKFSEVIFFRGFVRKTDGPNQRFFAATSYPAKLSRVWREGPPSVASLVV